MRILVTGGAGFIGSNFLLLMVPRHPEHDFINADELTYAANPRNLDEIAGMPNYEFTRVDIAKKEAVRHLFGACRPDWVIHFAAESHVDRSILGPAEFIETNIGGTFNLLEACRAAWPEFNGKLFHHVSTDEVYGSLGLTGSFTEETPYDPSSPYSASKAASDHLVRAYHRTYKLPVKVTNCSNNYGPRQFPEKLIPLMILNGMEGKPLPVYGKGLNVRDWLYVDDHCEAIWEVVTRGRAGETYNIGGNCEKANLEVVRTICQLLAEAGGRPLSDFEKLIAFVTDRPGHDLRYAINCSKIMTELGWRPRETFESGLAKTVRWYKDNPEWVAEVRSGAYRQWIADNYDGRGNSTSVG